MMFANVYARGDHQYTGNLVKDRELADELGAPCQTFKDEGRRRIGVLRVRLKDGVNRK